MPSGQIPPLDPCLDGPVKLCHRCQRPVAKFSDDYELFEGMHWLCFHLEFEHDAHLDEPCGDPSCPWWHIEVYKEALRQLNQDPDKILGDAITAMTEKDKSNWTP